MQKEWISGAECEALCRRFAPLGDVTPPASGMPLDQLSEALGISPSILWAALTPLRRQTSDAEVASIPEPEPDETTFEVSPENIPAAFRAQAAPPEDSAVHAVPTSLIGEVTERSPAELIGKSQSATQQLDIMNSPEQDEPPAQKPAWTTAALITACVFAVITVGIWLRMVWVMTDPKQPTAINQQVASDRSSATGDSPFASAPPFDDGTRQDSLGAAPMGPDESPGMPEEPSATPEPVEEPTNRAPSESSRLDEPLPAPGDDGSGIGTDPTPTEPQPADPPANLPEGPDATPPPSLPDNPE